MISYAFASGANIDADIAEAFEVFDREGKGYFSVEDLRKSFQGMPGFQKVPSNEVTEILRNADSEGNGVIHYKGKRTSSVHLSLIFSTFYLGICTYNTIKFKCVLLYVFLHY